MFDIKQIQQNAKRSEETLNAIKVKMKDLDDEFKKLETKYKSKDEEYYIEHSEELDEINEQIKKRLSVYNLLLEVAEDLSLKTADDLESIVYEFQKNQYYGS